MTIMCRGCLTTKMDLVPMDDTFINKFNLITGLNLNSFDSCLYSCQKCCNAVKFCMEFRRQCIESDWNLQEMAAQEMEDNCYTALYDDKNILSITNGSEVVNKLYNDENLEVTPENATSIYSTDVQTADPDAPASPPSRWTKNQRKKYAFKRRRAAMRDALANGDIRYKDTLVCSNAEVSDGGMTKMKSNSVTGKTLVTTSMVTPSSNEKISCSPILHLNQGQTTKRKNTGIQDCQAAKKLKINDCVKMGFSADRLNINIIHKNSQQDEKIEKAVNQVSTASLVIANASTKGTSFQAQGMATSVSTSLSPMTPAISEIVATKTSLISQEQTTKRSIFSSISLLHQAAMKSKMEDSPFMSPVNVEISGDKPKKKKKNKSKKQRMKMAELKQEQVNNNGAVVIIDNSKTGATSDNTVVATNSNSINVNQGQTNKCFRNPDTPIQNQYANINDYTNVTSNKGVTGVKLKLKKKKKGANDNNITTVVIPNSVKPPSYAKSATIAGATTAVIGAKILHVVPATVANNSAALKCSSGQNTKPKSAKSTPVKSCSHVTLFPNSGVTPVATTVAAKCCSVASLGKESITPEVQLNKERPPLSLNALYQMSSSVLKKKLVLKKKHKQLLKQPSVVKSVDAASLIKPGDDASVVIPDDAAPVTRSVDAASLIKPGDDVSTVISDGVTSGPIDAASLIKPGDDASVVIPHGVASGCVDAASLIKPGEDVSGVIPDDAASRSVDAASLIKPIDDASAVIPDGAAPVANSDGATPVLV